MKRVSLIVLTVLLILGSMSVPKVASACGSHGACVPPPPPCYGACGGGYYGRPLYYGRYGRYPLVGFRAPIRRFFGLPGFTPVRQFLFGRGHIRRVNRRAFLFG